MDDINWNDWLNREQLNLDELLLLSLEEDPNDKDLSFFDSIGLNNNEAYINRQGEAESWIRTGKLQGRRFNNGGSIEYLQINPVRFFELAKSNDWDLAQEISDFLVQHQNQLNVIWSGDIQPLEPLMEEQKQAYNSRTAWTWVDAIYILQGYKPVNQSSTEQVRSHFPQQVHDFTRSIQLGTIGKEINEAGERTFIDSPANWQAYLSASSLIKDWYHRIAFMLGDIELTIGSDSLLINWPHWLSIQSWTKEQAALLVCGIEPNGFHQDTSHESYKPFIELCQRTIEESGTPYYWLNKFNIEGYLDSVPTGVREWLAQQIERTQLEPQAETVASDGTNKNINTNTIAITNLLKAPTRQDNWFDVIADMTTVFHNTHGKLPNEAQAWGQLWTLPPAGYAIKTGTDKGEDNLTMPGVSPLSKSAFFKRWKKYNPDKP